MRPEVRSWVESVVATYAPKAPVLEVGSRDVNGTCRDLFPQKLYTGIDLEPAEGVDIVWDILDWHGSWLAFFNTVVCLETLEHVKDPLVALHNMHRYLRPGGLFIGTWIFNFPIHCPPDYWRATPEGFRYALTQAGFEVKELVTEGPSDCPEGMFAIASKNT